MYAKAFIELLKYLNLSDVADAHQSLINLGIVDATTNKIDTSYLPPLADHQTLTNRDVLGAHPITAITDGFSTDQTTPQTVSGGKPIFEDHLLSGSTTVNTEFSSRTITIPSIGGDQNFPYIEFNAEFAGADMLGVIRRGVGIIGETDLLGNSNPQLILMPMDLPTDLYVYNMALDQTNKRVLFEAASLGGSIDPKFRFEGKMDMEEARPTILMEYGEAIVIRDAVYISAAGIVSKAKADTSATLPCIGFATQTFIAGSSGDIQISGIMDGFVGLTAGATYYIDHSTAGAITTTPSVVIGEYNQPIGIALSTTQLQIQIAPVEEIVVDERILSIGYPDDTNGSYSGTTITLQSSVAISQYDTVYISGNRTVAPASADSATPNLPCIGIALNSAAGAAVDVEILIHGVVTNDSWSWTANDKIYLSETAGALTTTAPSDVGDYVQLVAVAITDDTILVNPSLETWVVT